MKQYKQTFSCMLLSICLLFSFLLSGCDMPLRDPISVAGYYFNTYVQIDSYTNISDDILNQCLALCETYENMFSRTRTDSTLAKVNRHEITTIPKELGELIQYGIDYGKITNGAFDITIGSVSSLWDFTADTPTVPDASAIQDALTFVDYTAIALQKKEDDTYTISLPEGVMLDLGAVAKGYVADRLKDFLVENGVKHAVINLGGNVLCIGGKRTNTNFHIGVKKPFSQTGELLFALHLNNQSAVSSGTYERYFYENDRFYHHILNPKTGYPYDTDITSVTILSDLSVIGDCLSTSCFVLGLEKGLELINATDHVEAVFATTDGTLHYSDHAKDYILQNGE